MIVVWRGNGGLLALASPILPLGLLAIVMIVGESIGATQSEKDHQYVGFVAAIAFAFGCLTTGFVCWKYGRRWNSGSNHHTLYFIPMQHWGAIYFSTGVIVFVAFITGSISTWLRMLGVLK